MKQFSRGKYNDSPLFNRDGWKACTPESLRGHIVNAHLDPETLCFLGVPLYDIEIAEARGFSLEWVVKRATDSIRITDHELLANCTRRLSPRTYRVYLVKTLHVIGEKALATIPWGTIEDVFPETQFFRSFNLKDDTKDISFHAYQEQLLAALVEPE